MTEAGNKRSRDDAEGTSVQAEEEGETRLIKAVPAECFVYGDSRRGSMERGATMASPALDFT